MRQFLFFLFFVLVQASYGQKSMLNDIEVQELIKKGLDKTYNFEFDAAKNTYEQVRKKYPEHPAYNFLIASNLFWEMLYYDNYQEKANEYFNYLQASLNLASKYLEKNNKDVEGIFFTMAIESSIALYYAERDETMKTLSHAKKAYGAMKEGFILKDKYVDFYFSTGLYNYFVIEYPATHPVYKPFMFFFTKGDKKRGIKELEYCVEHGIFSRTESLNYLTHIFLKYENDPVKSMIYSEQLIKKYPNNFYFISKHIECLIAMQKYKEAEILAYKLYQTGKKSFIVRSYVHYGLLHEKHFKNPEESMRYYKAAIKMAGELAQPINDYLSFAYAGIARLYHQQGKTAQAVEYYKKTKAIAEYASILKEAKEYLDKYD